MSAKLTFIVAFTACMTLFFSAYSQNSSLTFEDKEKILNSVYSQLISSLGHTRYPQLKFFQDKGIACKDSGACFDGSNTIYFEEALFDVCYGIDNLLYESSLAFILGHELTHYFIKEYDSVKTGATKFFDPSLKDNVYSKEEEEGTCDLYGAFYAHIAGFDHVQKTGQTTIKEVYTKFALNQKLESYPSLQERYEIVKRYWNEVEKSITLYDASNRMLVLNYHEPAYWGYAYLLKKIKFNSKELLNNLAVAALNAGLQVADEDFAYPFEISLATRLTSGKSKDEGASQFWFIEAESELTKALQKGYIKKQDPMLVLNLASAKILRGVEFTKAIDLVTPLINSTTVSTFTKAKAYLLIGIAQAKLGQEKNAIINFNIAKTIEDNPYILSLVENNLAVLSNEKSPIVSKPDYHEPLDFSGSTEERVDDIYFKTIEVNNRKFEIGNYVKKGYYWDFDFTDYNNSLLYIWERAKKSRDIEDRLFVQRIFTESVSSMKGAKIGTSLTELRQKYKKEYSIVSPISTNQGYYIIYPRINTAFLVNEGRVQEWLLYGTW